MSFEITQSTPIVDKNRYQKIIDNALTNGRKIPVEGLSLDDWLSLRVMLGIGASEVASALGINQYETPFALWQKKVSDEIVIEENDYMIWGNVVEPAIIDWYNKRTKQNAVKDKYMRIHPEYDCLFANLDGVLHDEAGNEAGLVECKSTTYRNYQLWEEDEEDCVQGIPLYMYCQVQHELSVTGLPWCDLAILITDRRQLKVKRILRDEEYIKKQNEALVLWWNAHVVPMVPPEMTATEWGYVDPSPDSFIEATTEIMSRLDEIKSFKEEKKDIEKKIKTAEEDIKLFLNDKENITSAGNVIASWKSQNRLYPDTEKLKAELPDYESKYTKLTTFRVLRIK